MRFMDNQPLERVVINCTGCKRENEAISIDAGDHSSTSYFLGKNVIVLNKPFHAYSCEICKVLYEFLERVSYDPRKTDKRRKNE